MIPQHVFSHQHQYADPTWQYQQAQQVQSAHANQHSQQSFGRNGASAPDAAAFMGPGAPDSAEERRILEWIAQLMRPDTRESALLELSKKREQFPQLALILWHSFGKPQLVHRRPHQTSY